MNLTREFRCKNSGKFNLGAVELSTLAARGRDGAIVEDFTLPTLSDPLLSQSIRNSINFLPGMLLVYSVVCLSDCAVINLCLQNHINPSLVLKQHYTICTHLDRRSQS